MGEDDYESKKYDAEAIGGHSTFIDKTKGVFNTMFVGPAVWFREKIVEPGRPDYPWYHRQYQRVPTIDKCEVADIMCKDEANSQYLRDKKVEQYILSILRSRMNNCKLYHAPNSQKGDPNNPCKEMEEVYEKCAINYFIKYGDVKVAARVNELFMKQKHRMIWERRHGPVGTGMKSNYD